MNIKKYFIPIIILLLLIQCKSEQKIDIYSSNFKEGWAGEPNNLTQKPFDYFYMKSTARASEKAIYKRSSEMMKSTCIDAAFTGVKGNLLGKLYGETIIIGSDLDTEQQANVIDYKEFSEELRSLKIKECKPLFEDEENFPNSGWKECECIFYIKIDGGREIIHQKFMKLELQANKKKR